MAMWGATWSFAAVQTVTRDKKPVTIARAEPDAEVTRLTPPARVPCVPAPP